MSLRALSLLWVYPKHVSRHWDRLLVPLSTRSSSSSSSSSSTTPASSTSGPGLIDQPPLPVVATTTVPVNQTIESSSPHTNDNTTTTTTTTDHPNIVTTPTNSGTRGASQAIETAKSPFSYKLPPWMDKLLEIWKKQSGTSEVLQLKQDVALKSQAFDAATARVTLARRHLDQTMLVWERIHGQHLQLLQKRETWTSYDAQQFATVVGQEVDTRNQMEQARTDLAEAEATLSQCQWEYMNAMRKRYHEEQIWQDQWRVLGTYGTWSLILLNSCVFLLSQFFHYRREAQKMKHLENLVLENVASQQAFKDSMVAERQAFARTSTAGLDDDPTTAVVTTETAANIPSDNNTVDNSIKAVSTTTRTAANEEVEASTTTQSLLEGEIPDTTIHNSDTKTTTTNSERKPFRWAWLQSIQEIKWVQSIVLSDLVQTTVQQTKGSLATSQAQTREFFQEVHLPSALLGASITGVVVIATMLLSSSSSSSSSSLFGRGR